MIANNSQLTNQPALSEKPVVYVASPYTQGDPAINVRFQCLIFDQMLGDGIVLPVVPLWAHFQHTLFPRDYRDWLEYDLAMIPRYDACLRLDAAHPTLGYKQSQSSGADSEVELFSQLGKPVFYLLSDCYKWADQWNPNTD
jgi:hypothetical protein